VRAGTLAAANAGVVAVTALLLGSIMGEKLELGALLADPEDEQGWRRLLNRLYLAEEDELFRQMQTLRDELRHYRRRERQERAA
jgi:hypothetical protein